MSMFENYEDPMKNEKFFSRMTKTENNSMMKNKIVNKCCSKLYAQAKDFHSRRKDKENQEARS